MRSLDGQSRRAAWGYPGARPASGRSSAPAFTLIDIIVSLAVIALLISILLPSLALVRETTRRVVCASNVRQIGLGLAMYADDNRGNLPTSVYLTPIMMTDEPQVQLMMAVRISDNNLPLADWDGLGWLYHLDYLNVAGVFYCPSHSGDHPLNKYDELWAGSVPAFIFGNYQYRGLGSSGEPVRLFERPSMAMVTDGMLTASDYSHRTGSNVLWNDLSVSWFNDGRVVADSLPTTANQADAADRVTDAWATLDLGIGRR